jgi:hypothetical protein
MTIAYTCPRQIVASDVRQGDQVATFAGTGDFAGIRAAERDDPDLIVWVEVDRFDHGFGDTPEGVVLVDGAVRPIGPLLYVVVREAVPVADR